MAFRPLDSKSSGSRLPREGASGPIKRGRDVSAPAPAARRPLTATSAAPKPSAKKSNAAVIEQPTMAVCAACAKAHRVEQDAIAVLRRALSAAEAVVCVGHHDDARAVCERVRKILSAE
jgi:hypothetical protein